MAVKRTRESEEMYLETILLLHRKKANVRAVDVCDELGYVKSSVSRGVNLLKKKGYITIDVATGDIEFTDTGRKKAEGIYERHKILTAALCKIGADPELAEENGDIQEIYRTINLVKERIFVLLFSFKNIPRKFINRGKYI